MHCRLSELSDEEMDDLFERKEVIALKTVVWTAANQDFIDKQDLKKALAAKAEVHTAAHC